MTAADFPIPEARLAEMLGVARKDLKAVRAERLERGRHWINVASGAVHYSPEAVTMALGALGIDPQKIALVLPAPAPAEAPPEVPEAVACEGCGEPATDFDAEGVHLCAGCAKACESDPLGENSSANDAPPDAPPAPPEVPAGPAEVLPVLDLREPDVVEVRVTRCFEINRRLVAGVIGERAVRVRVRSNDKLRVGMTLRCSLIEGDLFKAAERLPRRLGK